MRPSSALHATIAAGALFALVGGGCDALSYYPYDCAELSECSGNSCPGECVPLPPLGFDGPALLWIGPETQVPECPARAPQQVYEGRAGLDASHECPACECSQPACQFPDALTASDSAMCQGPQFTPFDAPAGWSGQCADGVGVISSNQLRSVTIEPVTERACEPVPPTVPHETSPIGWGVLARACRGEAIDTVCDDPGMTCLPSAEPPPPGFRQCIMYLIPDDGTGVQCPEDYPDMHVFFGDVEDTRACTECACTQTAASTCVAYMSTFQDTACTTPLISSPIGMEIPLCFDVMPGAALGSMQATWTTNQPGTCEASGGEAIGEVKPKDPRTFCCQPSPGG